MTTPPQTLFATAFDASPRLRQEVLTALQRIDLNLEEYDTPDTWENFLACLNEELDGNVSIVVSEGFRVFNDFVLYPLGKLDYHGTSVVNLQTQVASIPQFGPYASIVVRKDSTCPGLALHHVTDRKHLEIQLF